jgi:hypothetical protein
MHGAIKCETISIFFEVDLLHDNDSISCLTFGFGIMKFHIVLALMLLSIFKADAFVLPSRSFCGGCIQATNSFNPSPISSLNMAQEGKKKRRRRKQAPQPTDNRDMSSQESMIYDEGSENDPNVPSIDELKAIANFTPSKTKTVSNVSTEQSLSSSKPFPVDEGFDETLDSNSNLVELPDIRDALKNKELKKLEQEKEEVKSRPKISRKDRKALLQVRNFRKGSFLFSDT